MKKTNLFNITGLLVMFLFVATALGGPNSVVANDVGNEPQTLIVTGTGILTTDPDSAKVTFAVVTQGKTADQAQLENNKTMNNVRGAINNLGLSKDKIATSNYSVWPEYNYNKERVSKQPEIVGYRVQNELTVTISDLNTVGKLIDEVIKSGANQVSNIQFFKSDEANAKNEALALAAKDAKAKAESLADALGVKTVRILNVTESGGYVNPPVYYGAKMAAESYDLKIEPGQLKIQANVTITYEIK